MIDWVALALSAALHFHGASIHAGVEDRSVYNERNMGLGVSVSGWSLDVFRDSYNNKAGFVGREFIRPMGRVDAGFTAGYIYHTNYKGPGAIPYLRTRTSPAILQMIIIPNKQGVVYGFSLIVPIHE